MTDVVVVGFVLVVATAAAAAAAATAAVILFGNVIDFMLFRSTSNNFLSMPSDENELQTVRISRML